MRRLLIALLIWGCSAPISHPDLREAWFRQGQTLDRAAIALNLPTAALPIASIEPRDDDQDLAFLKPLVGDATVVGLGESAHGSHQLFQLQRRVAQYLMTELGFTVVAFEASWPETLAFPRYLQEGREPVQAAVEHLGYRMWKTTEMTDFLTWMRLTNQQTGLAQPLMAVGFDVQSPKRSMAEVIRFYELALPDEVQRVQEAYACFPVDAPDRYASATPAQKAACEAAIAAVQSRLENDVETLSRIASPWMLIETIRHAWLVTQAVRLWSDTRYLEFNARRDEAIADQLRWIAETAHPGRKILVWGHQLHTGVHATEPGLPLSMGHHLRRRLGPRYVSLGFTFDRGIIQADPGVAVGTRPNFVPTAVADAEAGSLESFLSEGGPGPYFLDVRNAAPDSAVGRMLRTALPVRAVGLSYDPARPRLGFQRATAATAFDGLVFVRETAPTQILAGTGEEPSNAGPRP